MTDFRCRWLFLVTLVMASCSSSVRAENEVELKAWIEPKQNIVVSQQISLFIEVATPTWFTGGTQISSFEVDDLVVLRRDKFAVNSTRRRGADTWTVQLWTLTLYPQRNGQFMLPPIELKLSIADENGQPSERQFTTKPIMFQAFVPDQALTSKNWLATERFEVSERFDKPLTDLAVGSSIKRTIEIRAQNLAAMMLPEVTFNAAEGLAAYHSSPVITDTVSRGIYQASRTEVVTYLVEKAGAYTLPELRFNWWDLAIGALQQEVISEKRISTAGAADSEAKSVVQSREARFLFDPQNGILIFMGFCFLGAIAWWYQGHRSRSKLQKANRLRKIERLYRSHCEQGNFQQAAEMLYQWVALRLPKKELSAHEFSLRTWLQSEHRTESVTLFDALMSAAHGRNSPDQRFAQEIKELPQSLELIIKSACRREVASIDEQLRLN